jgi:hypothetical protein
MLEKSIALNAVLPYGAAQKNQKKRLTIEENKYNM